MGRKAHGHNSSSTVPNAPIREALERMIGTGEITLQEVALNGGWMRQMGGGKEMVPDGTTVARALGMTAYRGKAKVGGGMYADTVTTHLSPERAKRIVFAMHMDPVDFGF